MSSSGQIMIRLGCGQVLAEGESIRSAAESACKTGADLYRADLRGADLRGADLYRADLRGADLYRADLRGADLYGANLYGADLRGADLRGADLRGADLRGADLRGADLRGADLYRADLRGADLYCAELRGADLRGANLRGAKGVWQSHDVIAEMLFRDSGDSVERRKIAGLILISRDWCWDKFLGLGDPESQGALRVLAEYANSDDESVPGVIRALMTRPETEAKSV